MGPAVQTIDRTFREGIECHRAGELHRAAAIYEEVLRQEPNHAGAWHLLGVAHFTRGDLAAALSHVEHALSLCQTKPAYWNNYGAVLKDLGRLDDARAAFERAIELRPLYADAWSNLGLVHSESGRLDEAERCLRYALRLQPRHADALRHLARVYRDKGNLDEAVRLCHDALAVSPRCLEAYSLLGEALSAQKRFEEAAEAYRGALAIKPDSAEAHVSLGLVYSDLDEVEEARKAFHTAASLRPNKPSWRLRVLGLCPIVSDSAEAIAEYRANLERRLDEALANPPPFDWRSAFRDGFTPSFQLAFHGACNRGLLEKFGRLFAPPFPRDRPARRRDGKVRVGFLVSYGHQGGFLRGFGGIVQRLDRSEFEVVGLASQGIVGQCRAAVRADDVHWVGFPHEVEPAFAAIRAAECDILIHWHAGSDVVNYFLPFLPLAPVQCLGFGNHGTGGIAGIDYFVSSRLFERGEGAEGDYTESLVRFRGATSWQPRPRLAAPAARSDFGLPASGSLYLCPRLAKLQPDFDPLLRSVLDADPDGRLLILQGDCRRAVESLRRRFQRTLGSALVRRVVFVASQKPDDYYRLLSLADVLLDAPAFSASASGYDALGLGVPIVTLPGRCMFQRYALGLYRKMDYTEPVAGSPQEYVDKAVRLGTDRDYRETVRAEIDRRSEALFEDGGVVGEYEEFFRRAIRRVE